jgi:transposase
MGRVLAGVFALIVTPEGFPLAYEVLPGNTADCTTLRGALCKIEAQYGKAERIWVMDRGVPTEEVLEVAPKDATFSFALNRDKLRQTRRREGRYLLRTNLCDRDPAHLWQFYIQLVEVEAAFKNLKDDLQLRPIYHQLEHRIEAHIFVAFLAYCLHVTMRAKLKPLAPGLTPRAVLDKLTAIQMLDVHFPTTDGRTLILSRYTELNAEQKLLVNQLKLDLPPQPPPRITAQGTLARQPTHQM